MAGTEVLVALLKVAIVLVLLIGALRLLGRFQRGGGGGGRALRARTSVLEVVDQTRLGRTSSVVALRAGDRVMVLGVSDGGIEHLADISEDIDLAEDELEGDEPNSVLDHALDLLRTGDIRR
ncbi:MAG: flagellar biosynthetic protein FliO [Actinomycetota bacterium]